MASETSFVCVTMNSYVKKSFLHALIEHFEQLFVYFPNPRVTNVDTGDSNLPLVNG